MKRILLAAGIVGLAACSDATSPGANANAALKPKATVATSSSTVVVSPANMNGWYFWNDKNDTFTGSPGSLVGGPAPTPLGSGSVRLGPLTDDGQTGAGYSVIATNAYVGTPLSQITSLSYATYQPGPTLAIALQFDVRYRTSDVAYGGRLIFEPYQTVGTVGSGWQTWSPLAGKWWASKTTAAGSNGLCPQSAPCTWSDIMTAFPNAVVSGRFLLRAGSSWNGFDGNADALAVGVNGVTTTYDFEGSFGACNVSVSGTTITLLSNCTTDHTLTIPQGFTLDGNGFTITAVDPSGAHFLGAVIRNGGTVANVHDLTVTASGLVDNCDAGDDRLRGILFDGASGNIASNNVHGVRQGLSGCQEGNAIEVRNAPFDNTGHDLSVNITSNTVSDYQKNGITANGSVAATISGNVVIGDGGITYIAQNGIQVGFGATATLMSNTVSGNNYTPSSDVACGILLYQASGVKSSKNTLFNNERDNCNFGKGGGTFKPSN